MRKTLLLIAGMLATVVASADTEWSEWSLYEDFAYIDGNKIIFSINEDNSCQVAEQSGTVSGTLTIPETVSLRYRRQRNNVGTAEYDYKTVSHRVTQIGHYAFGWIDSSGLTKVTIPSSVTSIGHSAFAGSSGLTDITIPSSVTSIGECAFCNCSGLKSVIISEGVKSIGDEAFKGCSGLTSVTIPSSVASIGRAFSGCSALTNVTISEGVTSIGQNAFYNCSGLTSVTIPSSVTSIGDDAFYGCTSVKSVYVYATLPNTDFLYDFKGLEALVIDGHIDEVSSVGGSLKHVSLKGVKNIRGSFDGMTSLTNATLSEGLTCIGDYAFYGCSGLKSITIPSSVESIGYFAFRDCSNLKGSITLGEGFTSIGEHAFRDCCGLTGVITPSTLTSIGWGTFSGCSGLTSVTLSEGLMSIGQTAFYGCSGLKSIAIPSSVVSIGSSAFGNCSGLISLEIPPGVTSIGNGAFSDCGGLISVTIPEGVKSIGNSAFYNCSALRNVTIPSSVTSIGDSAFYGCSKLGSVDIGASVASLGEKCFCSCMNLTNVVFHGNAPTTIGGLVFSETSLDLNVVVPVGSVGWNGDNASATLPARWPYNTETGRYIRNAGDDPISSERVVEVQLSVTNIVVNYVLNSVQPEFAVPVSSDTGFVNIIAEVHGSASGAVAVPDSWPANYKEYHKKFGSDFTQSLTQRTGKKDGTGNDMFVWQDFVAGTDPTDENDQFTASITIVDGVPVISYTPELTAEQAALRVYKTYGKMKLTDTAWTDITSKTNEERADYNFFKVTVEMK